MSLLYDWLNRIFEWGLIKFNRLTSSTVLSRQSRLRVTFFVTGFRIRWSHGSFWSFEIVLNVVWLDARLERISRLGFWAAILVTGKNLPVTILYSLVVQQHNNAGLTKCVELQKLSSVNQSYHGIQHLQPAIQVIQADPHCADLQTELSLLEKSRHGQQ